VGALGPRKIKILGTQGRKAVMEMRRQSSGALEGRVALVTGGGRGIGAAIATYLARQGAAVVVNDFGVAIDGTTPDGTVASAVADSIKAEGGQAVAHFGDVSDSGTAKNMIDAALETYGQLNVVINVAGILRDKMIFNMSVDEWDDVMRVHLRGTFNTIRHASALWREARDQTAQNRIINFTSDSGLFGNPGQPNYAAAKLGIVGLTMSAAHSLYRYGVRVNAISPTVVTTRMVGTIPGVEFAADDPRTPENIAPVVAYLASERSNWCTGRVFGVNGYRVALYRNPQIDKELVGTGPWDLADLGANIERAFGSTRNGAEGRYGNRGIPSDIGLPPVVG
jgi:NAD(P)-dependent dehydrogenase (short-subunit alcohol dehydrogenase family)